jgi:hypothetical protein
MLGLNHSRLSLFRQSLLQAEMNHCCARTPNASTNLADNAVPSMTQSHIEKTKIICLTVTCATFNDVRRNRNSCTPHLRSQTIQLFSRKPCGHTINQYCYLVSQFKCPKFCVIAHDLSLTVFSLQSIHLSNYIYSNLTLGTAFSPSGIS